MADLATEIEQLQAAIEVTETGNAVLLESGVGESVLLGRREILRHMKNRLAKLKTEAVKTLPNPTARNYE